MMFFCYVLSTLNIISYNLHVYLLIQIQIYFIVNQERKFLHRKGKHKHNIQQVVLSPKQRSLPDNLKYEKHMTKN